MMSENYDLENDDAPSETSGNPNESPKNLFFEDWASKISWLGERPTDQGLKYPLTYAYREFDNEDEEGKKSYIGDYKINLLGHLSEKGNYFSSDYFRSIIQSIKKCYPALFPPKRSWRKRAPFMCAIKPDALRPCGPKRVNNLCLGLYKFITVLAEVVAVSAAVYFFWKWTYLRKNYNYIVREVRDAQHDKITLEDELARLEGHADFVGDEIGDTKRHIMLGEIERITQYLRQAKYEVTKLIKQKNELRTELTLALKERDQAMSKYKAALERVSEPSIRYR